MKALLLKDKGLWKDMTIGETPTPEPQAGELLMEVHAVSLNPVDYKTATNGHPHWSYPHILGLDFAGIVAAVGTGVTDWKPGDRAAVHGDLTKKGGYAEYAIAQASAAFRIPETVSFVEAASVPTAGLTAYQALFRKLPINRIESIFIHGGAGGVGGFAVQLAKWAGIKTIISSSSPENFPYVASLGAHHVVDYRDASMIAQCMNMTHHIGVDAVIDAVSRQSATDALQLLAFMGHLVFIAGPPDTSGLKPFTKVPSIHEIALGAAYSNGSERDLRDLSAMGEHLLSLIAESKISPLYYETIALDEVPKSLQRLSERHVKGKIIVKMK
ncbi:zinc-binding dehydrogenase [Paenibacillus sp. PL2-23]|uniref:zinc-binding dehydrogenase n=1 Tax=Paenibacillus sp. PL2-23 TaxID=2100729 RepID=UPI0030FB3F9B